MWRDALVTSQDAFQFFLKTGNSLDVLLAVGAALQGTPTLKQRADLFPLVTVDLEVLDEDKVLLILPEVALLSGSIFPCSFDANDVFWFEEHLQGQNTSLLLF